MPPNTVEEKVQLMIDARLKRFELQLSSIPGAYRLACYAAYPHTLTVELLHCLRDNFVLESPWYVVGDILLSNFCRRIGRDLYAMDMPIREALLRELVRQTNEGELEHLQNFMAEYIQSRISEKGSQAQVYGSYYHWLPLACLRPGEAKATIERELQAIIDRDHQANRDPRERFQMAALVEAFADLPAMRSYRDLLLQWSVLAARGLPIENSLEDDWFPGFPEAKILSYYETELVREDRGMSHRPSGLEAVTFETPTVNAQGVVIEHRRLTAYYFTETLPGCDRPLEMIAIRSGAFLMGSPDNEKERHERESPQHLVTVPPFFISKYPITQAQWRSVAQLNPVDIELDLEPSSFKGDDRPVERVSWHEAIEFCKRLSQLTGRDAYRLPSEAEWEYACRGGSQTPFAYGETITTDLVNFDGDYTYGSAPKGKYRKQTTNVGSFPPNAFGLCDMHGNVWEWCQDTWHENYNDAPNDGSAWVDKNDNDYYSLRGGSWFNYPRFCRSALRIRNEAGERGNYYGFRVVCTVPRLL